MKIASSDNVEAACYAGLAESGYDISIIDSVCGRAIAIARKGDVELVASSMLELLGLAALAEKRGERWPASEAEMAEYKNKLSDT